MHLAAAQNHTGCVKALLEAGADPDATDIDGNTALILAAFKSGAASATVALLGPFSSTSAWADDEDGGGAAAVEPGGGSDRGSDDTPPANHALGLVNHYALPSPEWLAAKQARDVEAAKERVREIWAVSPKLMQVSAAASGVGTGVLESWSIGAMGRSSIGAIGVLEQ